MLRRPDKIIFKIILTYVMFFSCDILRAEEVVQDAKAKQQLSPFQTTESHDTIRSSLAMHYSRLTTTNTTLSVFSFSASIQKIISEKFAIGGVIGQAFSGEGRISSLFTSLKGSVEYALTGALEKPLTKTLYEGSQILAVDSYYPGGWRATFYLSQYFLNAEKAAVPYSGPGLSVSYDFASDTSRFYGVGLLYESMGNAKAKLSTVGLSFQLGFY